MTQRYNTSQYAIQFYKTLQKLYTTFWTTPQHFTNSQLYKQAGNSIVVDVLYYILRDLKQVMPYLFDNLKLGSFFSGIGAFEKALERL